MDLIAGTLAFVAIVGGFFVWGWAAHQSNKRTDVFEDDNPWNRIVWIVILGPVVLLLLCSFWYALITKG